MAKEMLPVNFMDDILDPSMNGKRRFNMIQNDDGTVSFEDATDYSQIGSDFGQKQVNQTNQAVNESADKNRIIDDLDDIAANTQAGMMAGALAVRQLNSNLSAESKNIDEIQSKLRGLGQRVVVGRHTPSWKISGDYYNIGNKITAVNNEFYISRLGSANIDIKKSGKYLIIVNFPFSASGNTTVWVSVRNKGKEIKNAQAYSYNGYATVNLALVAELNEWDYIDCYVSANGVANTTGNETMEIVKLV